MLLPDGNCGIEEREDGSCLITGSVFLIPLLVGFSLLRTVSFLATVLVDGSVFLVLLLTRLSLLTTASFFPVVSTVGSVFLAVGFLGVVGLLVADLACSSCFVEFTGLALFVASVCEPLIALFGVPCFVSASFAAAVLLAEAGLVAFDLLGA